MNSHDPNEDGEDYVLVTGSDTEDAFLSGERPEVIAQIKQWLSPTEFDSDTSDYKKHLNSHVQGTGQWIQATDQYRRWYNTDEIGDLWIRGIPGSGKSVVAASLIRDLKNRGDAPVLFFFFRHIIVSNRTPQSLLRDCSYQLLDYSHSLQSSLKKAMKAHPNVNEVPMDELWKCFSSALSGMEKVYCVIDALDEMESGHDSFLADLLNLGRRNPKSVKLALTSRQLPHLEAHLKGSCLVDLRLDRKNVDRDIATYISYRLKNREVNLSEEQSNGIEEAICEKGKGLFLYARLMMDQCLQDPAHFISQLDKLPDGLGNMYTDLLQEHAARSGTTENFQRMVLEWITHSTRPLRLLELTAVINSLPHRGGLKPDQDTKMSIRTCCGPLLELCEDQVIQIIHHSFTEFLLDPDQHHVQMTSKGAVRFPVLNPALAHRTMATACVKYLRSSCFNDWELSICSNTVFEREDQPRTRKNLWTDPGRGQRSKPHIDLILRFPFLDYAAQWPVHAVKLLDPDAELFEQLDSFMQDGNHDFESWKDFWGGLNTALPENFSPLHVAAHCGLLPYTERLLRLGADPNVADSYRRTPTTYAAMEGHDRILEILVGCGAQFDNPDTRGLAPLHHAARRNQAAALRVLLDLGADPLTGKTVEEPYYEAGHSKSTVGDTALTYICEYGYVEALNELLKHLDPSQLLDGPLHWAADQGRAEILTVILQHEQVQVHINDKDENGNTPLFLAARARDPPTVRVLLDHKADVHGRSEDRQATTSSRPGPKPPEPRVKKPKLGYTAIHGLVHFNHRSLLQRSLTEIMEVLDLLIAGGADIDARDEKGQTALFAWNGARDPKGEVGEAFISTFLGHGADATVTDLEGSTLLHTFTGFPKERNTLRMMVAAGANINAVRKSDGETPLITATRRSQLMDPTMFHDFNADFNRQDLQGNTAFHYACSSWMMESKHADIWLSFADPTIRDNAGRTAASYFMWGNGGQGRVDALPKMVKMGLPLESRDHLGRTLLLQFLSHDNIYGRDNFVRMLLSLGADAKTKDYEGKSAFHLLAVHPLSNQDGAKKDLEKITQVMQELIEAGADLHAVDNNGNTPLHDALGLNDSVWPVVRNLDVGVAAMINFRAPVKSLNHQGRTIMHIAAAVAEDHFIPPRPDRPFSSCLEFCLQKHLDLDVNARDHEGITPLHLAAATSELRAWKLIQSGADVEGRTLRGLTPLHFAAKAGKCNVIDLLIGHYQANSLSLDCQDLKGRTPLHEAARSGRPESVKILLDAGASFSIRDKRGRTALHASAEFEEVPLAQTTQHAYEAKDPSALEERGNYRELPKTAFDKMEMMISVQSDPKCIRGVVRLLLDAGTDAGQLDDNEHTSSEVAIMLGNSAVVEELAARMATLYTAGTSSNPSALKPLDRVGEILSAPSRYIRETIRDIDFADNSDQFFKRIISYGDGALLEEVITARMSPDLLVQPDGSSPLQLIAECGLASMMKRILPFFKNVSNFSPPLLHAALKRRIWNMEMINVLIQHGVDVNAQYSEPQGIPQARSRSRRTMKSHRYAAVHVLASGTYWWYPKALQALLKAGADPEALNDNGETPLQLALAALHPSSLYEGFWGNQTVDVLLESGANVNLVASETDLTPLNTALESHCGPDIIQKLLDHGADASFGPKPAIASAVDSRDYTSLELLLKGGADPNQVYMSNEVKRYEDGTQLETPLQNAACGSSRYGYDPHADLKRSAIITLLLEHGANPNQQLKDGRSTVLHEIAALNGFIRPMLTKGGILEERDADGCTPLIRSCALPETYKRAIESEYAALELIEAGADINAVDNTGSTALHYAITSDLPKTFKLLLSKGASPNIKDNTGTAPLYYSFDSWRFQDVADLLDAGADPLQRAPDGRTPLHYLAPKLMQHGCTDSDDLITGAFRKPDELDDLAQYTKLYGRCIEAGCDLEARDDNGNTPIFAFVSTVKDYDDMNPDSPPDPKDIRKMFEEHDVLAVNNDGDTLLHIVAGREEEPYHQEDGLVFWEMLVEMGLDPKSENKSGATAVDVAAACGSEKILGLFARDE